MLGHLVVGRYSADARMQRRDAMVDFFARMIRALLRRK